MNLFKKTIILALLIILITPVSISAQEEVAGYVVQSGDTLYSIAMDFGVTVNDIITLNNISNPNSISIGTVLLIPGLDWLTGIIQNKDVVIGDSTRNIKRLYNISQENFVRLNKMTSPNQMIYGDDIVITYQQEGLNNAGRQMLDDGQSMFEQSVINGVNPWQSVLDNKLVGTWQSIDGDVLFLNDLLATPNSPIGFPSDLVSLLTKNTKFIQGETANFQAVLDSGSLVGKFLDYEFEFYSLGNGYYAGLQGIPAMLDPGSYEITFEYTDELGKTASFSQYLYVYDGGYIYEKLTVPNDFLADEISDIEADMIAAIVAEKSPEKLWDGSLFPPSIYADTINSTFGNRRSYNGSPYDYYHTGVDFGGGIGVQIFAVADGTVVFAQETTVRGNAVIIDHGWGIYSGYWHQSEIMVSVGDVVQEGDVIGLVGNTGRSSGAHLHLELWVNQVPVNPLSWIYGEYP